MRYFIRYKFIFYISFMFFGFSSSVFAIDFKGRVLDINSKTPLAGATVYIKDASAEVYTDDKGEFTYSGLIEGKHTIMIAYPGYILLEMSIVIAENSGNSFVFEMRPDPAHKGLEASVEGEKLVHTVSRETITIEEIESLPGTGGDIVKAIITSFPGVAYTSALNSANFVVRGGNPDDNFIYIDGLLALFPFHFGGFATIFPSDVVSSIDFFAGGFPAGYGHVTGSILDIKTKQMGEDRFKGKVNVNLLTANFVVEGPITDELYIILAGRRSYFEVILSTGIVPFDIVPFFWDYYAKVTWHPNQYHWFNIIGLGAFDRISTRIDNNITDVDAAQGDVSFDNNFYAQGINWKWIPNNKVYNEVTLGYTFNFIDFQIGNDPFTKKPYTFTVNLNYFNLKTLTQFRIGDYQTFKVGLLGFIELAPFELNLPERGANANNITPAEELKDSMFFQNYGFYASDIIELPWITLTLGFDFNLFIYDVRTDQYYHPSFSPRLSFEIPLWEGGKLLGATGLYFQNQDETELLPEFGDPSLPEIVSAHYIFGYKHQFNRLLSAKFELYYKSINNLAVSTPVFGPDSTSGLTPNGSGEAYGFELFIKQELWQNFFAWIAYTYSVSTRRDASDQQSYAFAYDQNHILTVIASYSFADWFNFAFKYRFSSGEPYTPYIGREIDPPVVGENPTYKPIRAARNSGRFPNRGELTVRFEFLFDNKNFKLYFEFINALDAKNVINYSYENDYSNYDNPGEVYDLSLLPSFGIEYKF